MTKLTVREEALLNAATDPLSTCDYLLDKMDFETGRRGTCSNGCTSEPGCQTSPVTPGIVAFQDLRDRYVYECMWEELDTSWSDPHPNFVEEYERLERELFPDKAIQ